MAVASWFETLGFASLLTMRINTALAERPRRKPISQV
jgi:hypothetical protein